VAEEAARIAVRPSLTRRQTAVDVAVAILLIPASSSASLLLAGWLAPGPPNVVLVVFVQGLLALAGLAMLLAWRRQSWHEIGLKALEPRDLPRSLVVLLTVFGANMLLTLAIFAVAPQVLRDHLAGLQSIALGLTADAPLAGALGLLLLVGFYEEAVNRERIERMDDFANQVSEAFPPEYEDLRVGSTVRHPIFGAGKVTAISQPWPNTRVEVFFESTGPKTLVLALSRLSVV